MSAQMKRPFPFFRNRFGALTVVLVSLAGCTKGNGSGVVTGRLYVHNCRLQDGQVQALGSREAPAPYRIDPEFLAGEPLEDPRSSGDKRENRLSIRLQSTRQNGDINDTLSFQVSNSFLVAQCVRGRMARNAEGELKPDFDLRVCSWGPDGRGPARLRVGPDFPVRANLAPRTTCPRNDHVIATAVGREPKAGSEALTADKWESWIEIVEFGGASATEAASEREAVGNDFKVSFGGRIRATAFRLTLTDDLVLKSEKRNDKIPEPGIEGELVGEFDFAMERGQGYQAFP